jgi:lipooligosaccharide transport system permease protein
MVLFRAVGTGLGILAVPAAVLTGLAFAAPILAFAATQDNDSGFNAVQRFLIIPLFLLGGTFFPIAKLPLVFQVIAWATPLAHGVALARGLTLGSIDLGSALIHTAVICAYVAGGVLLASFTMRRRLRT